MRDIQAELEQWDCDSPIRWEPSAGDILIGIVREQDSPGREDVANTLTVQEEETGLWVAIPLDSPDLAKLVKLQHPRAGERIGIKCLGAQESGRPGFVLMVDRSEQQPQRNERHTATLSQPPESEDDADSDDTTSTEGATQEERSFIEQALLADESTSVPDSPFPTPTDGTLRNIIQRQDEQIAQQTESIRELEGILASAIPLLCNNPEPAPSDSSEIDKPISKYGSGPFKLGIVFTSSLSLALACYLTYVLLWARP